MLRVVGTAVAVNLPRVRNVSAQPTNVCVMALLLAERLRGG